MYAECLVCKKDSDIYGKGKCFSCYRIIRLQNKRAKGECDLCPAQSAEGKFKCQYHLDKISNNRYMVDCKKCGKNNRKHGTGICTKCYNKDLRHAKALRGECRNCTKPAIKGRKSCEECLDKAKGYRVKSKK